MDGAVRRAIAEITRDDAFARTIAELSAEDRAALATRLRALLAENRTGKRSRTPSTAAQTIVVRCGDRGCPGVVAEATRLLVHFVSLEKSADPTSADEMVIVDISIAVDHDTSQGHSPPAYCPQCWMQFHLDDVLQEVRTALLLGRSRRTMLAKS